ncbi:MAG TPA: hypothetical protein DEB06_04525 [Phycisphaerales bacterium]|nr:hypothetical protein [Phycisphaerales bacterium]
MIGGSIIAMVVALVLHDAFPDFPLAPGLDPRAVALAAVLPQGAIAMLLHAWVRRCAHRLDRTGRAVHLIRAERGISTSRAASLAVHLIAVLWLGWPDAIRAGLGFDPILLDEAIALAPGVGALIGSWWSASMIDRRLREALVIRSLDEGSALRPIPTRAGFVWEQVRHQLLFVLVPFGLISAWMEAATILVRRAVERWPALDGPWGSALDAGAQLAGVVIVLALAPLLPRVLWDTVPLGPGPLRERLLRLCAEQRVRCGPLLVWRTHGGALNGAMIGALPWFRSILLTDALLEHLNEAQVEGVMAHEVAHARRHHIPWLMAALLASVGGAWTIASLGSMALRAVGAPGEGAPGAVLLAAGAGMWALGFVSRRFEHQADAFAAQHLSGARPGGAPVPIRPEAAGAMSGALGEVAAMNAIPLDRFTHRHGSILARQQHLASLVGEPSDRLPIDRTVRRIKWTIAVGVALVIVASVLEALIGAG